MNNLIKKYIFTFSWICIFFGSIKRQTGASQQGTCTLSAFKIQNTNQITNSNIGNTFHLSGLSVNFGSHVTSSYRPAMKLDGVWVNKPKTQDLPLQVMLLLMVLSHTRCYRLYPFDSIGMGGGSNLAVSRLEKHAWKVEMRVTLTCAKKECQFLWRSKRSTFVLKSSLPGINLTCNAFFDEIFEVCQHPDLVWNANYYKYPDCTCIKSKQCVRLWVLDLAQAMHKLWRP